MANSVRKIGADEIMGQAETPKLGKNEFYKCPFEHAHPKHKLAFFRNFDQHFRVFGDKLDHFKAVQLHEELAWNARHAESERRNLSKEDLQKISFNAWMEAIKQITGKTVEVVKK
jgi:hypothetical protein